MFGFRPASDGRALVPVSLRARSIGAVAGLMSLVGLVASVFALIFTLLASPFASASAAVPVQGAVAGSFHRADLSGKAEIDPVAVARAGSTAVPGKIEAIRRMGSRSMLRMVPRHDLIVPVGTEKLAESTEIPVRTVTRNGAFRIRVHDGLGRAPPGIDL